MSDPTKLTAADILSTDDRALVEFAVPEWPKDGRPGVLLLQPLSAGDAMLFAERQADPEKAHTAMIFAFTRSAVDDQRKPLFTETDVERLKEKSFTAFRRVQEQIIAMNHLYPGAVQAQAETVKND